MTQPDAWPALPWDEWAETAAALHLWLQVAGKVRLATSPWINHSWHATFYPSARGLTTGTLARGTRVFQIDFDFLDHLLVVSATDGARRQRALQPESTASFCRGLLKMLGDLGVPVHIHPAPNEMPEAVPFLEDERARPYDRDAAQRFWRALCQAERVFRRFRSRFLGKCSPVHLFWGAMDLAVTRFSGHPAPQHPGGIPHLPDAVTREAYSHQVSSAGFWAGNGGLGYPAFYTYAYPEPEGFGSYAIQPAEASYSPDLHEFLLPYEAVRTSPDPDGLLLAFLQSGYEAAADLGRWDRQALERAEGSPLGGDKPASA